MQGKKGQRGRHRPMKHSQRLPVRHGFDTPLPNIDRSSEPSPSPLPLTHLPVPHHIAIHLVLIRHPSFFSPVPHRHALGSALHFVLIRHPEAPRCCPHVEQQPRLVPQPLGPAAEVLQGVSRRQRPHQSPPAPRHPPELPHAMPERIATGAPPRRLPPLVSPSLSFPPRSPLGRRRSSVRREENALTRNRPGAQGSGVGTRVGRRCSVGECRGGPEGEVGVGCAGLGGEGVAVLRGGEKGGEDPGQGAPDGRVDRAALGRRGRHRQLDGVHSGGECCGRGGEGRVADRGRRWRACGCSGSSSQGGVFGLLIGRFAPSREAQRARASPEAAARAADAMPVTWAVWHSACASAAADSAASFLPRVEDVARPAAARRAAAGGGQRDTESATESALEALAQRAKEDAYALSVRRPTSGAAGPFRFAAGVALRVLASDFGCEIADRCGVIAPGYGVGRCNAAGGLADQLTVA